MPSMKIKKLVRQAASIIKRGGVVVFPTETVYGIGADATNTKAVKKIYHIKKRPPTNPLIVHVTDINMVKKYITGNNISPVAQTLIKKFWPGPLTIVLKNSLKKISPSVTAGLETIAVRAPSHTIARSLIKLSGVPIAAPSANFSGKVSPTSYEHVLEDYFLRKGESSLAPDMILPGGRCLRGIESTIVDITDDENIRILRYGSVPPEKIASALRIPLDTLLSGTTSIRKIPKRLSSFVKTPAGKILAPGMMKKHYCPEAKVYLFPTERKLYRWFCELDKSQRHHQKFFVIGTAGLKKQLEGKIKGKVNFGIFGDENNLARKLYEFFRKADKLNSDIILVSMRSPHGIGMAINDRLLRSATRIIGGDR